MIMEIINYILQEFKLRIKYKKQKMILIINKIAKLRNKKNKNKLDQTNKNEDVVA